MRLVGNSLELHCAFVTLLPPADHEGNARVGTKVRQLASRLGGVEHNFQCIGDGDTDERRLR